MRGAPFNIPDFATGNPDPRVWTSIATVDDDEPVTFDEDLGPLVNVTLQPSKDPLVCRVASMYAGNGEGEYVPFVAGDEVVVLLLDGSPRAGGVVVGKLNNGIDRFPSSSVAGQDPTTNTFAFRRNRTAFIHEAAGPYTIRQSTSGAFVSIDASGTLTLRDGQKSALQISPDVFGFQSGDANHLIQLDMSGERFTLQVRDAIFTMSSSNASPETSALSVPGTLSIATSSNPAAEHATSIEAVCNVLVQIFSQLGGAITAALPGTIVTPAQGSPLGPLIGIPLGLVFTNAFAQVAAGVAAASTSPQNAAVASAIAAAFTSASQKPPGTPGQGQLAPGVGCAGLFVG